MGFAASNNEAEYKALIAGLRLAKGIRARNIKALCGSELVANQLIGEFETREECMKNYVTIVWDLDQFDKFELTRI